MRPRLLRPPVTQQAFASLPFPASLLDKLEQMGYRSMTPIQSASLPVSLAGKDLIAQANTGSGKTAAFGLALLSKLNPRFFGTQALVLCPTRELATQVAQELRKLASYQQNIKVVVLCGGQGIGPQIGSLEHGAHIVVGTPGRIQDHLNKNTLTLSDVNTVVLDEADRMLEMGFVDAIDSILSVTPSTRQTLLFSATYPPDIERLSQKYQSNPTRVTVVAESDEGTIDERLFEVTRDSKGAALLAIIRHFRPESSVLFCNTKQSVRETVELLRSARVSADALHGDMEQRDRDQVLVRFKQKSMQILVASDVAARGLDVDDLSLVINVDMPRDVDVYTHRIGRTGRAGKSGLAASLVERSEQYKVDQIGTQLQRKLHLESWQALPVSDQALSGPSHRTVAVNLGRRQKIRPGDLVGAFVNQLQVPAEALGNITVSDNQSFVAIAADSISKNLQPVGDLKIKGRSARVRVLR